MCKCAFPSNGKLRSCSREDGYIAISEDEIGETSESIHTEQSTQPLAATENGVLMELPVYAFFVSELTNNFVCSFSVMENKNTFLRLAFAVTLLAAKWVMQT